MKVLCNVVWEKVGGGNLGRESAEEELGGGCLLDWGLTRRNLCLGRLGIKLCVFAGVD